ncbi:MAG TPA: hypothetical protein VEF71_03395 [Streptosporangiaceae bacterium]|nr:hypothetical protein [Streptosporangiaceae bacterium]
MISRKAKKLALARMELQELTPAELAEVSGGGHCKHRRRRHHHHHHHRHHCKKPV